MALSQKDKKRIDAEEKYRASVRTTPTANADDKSKIVAGILALFLGGLGIHKFYLGNTGQGITLLLLTLFLWWTIVVPMVIGVLVLIDAIALLTMPDDVFNEKYNS